MGFLFGLFVGGLLWFFVFFVLTGFYTVGQDEKAVITSFGRARRIPGKTTLDNPISQHLRADEKERYIYPQVEVVQPGGPYFKWPWQRVRKVSIATQTYNMALDPEDPEANNNGTVIDAVTKDQLNIGLRGQIRFKVSEKNLYAYIFGVKQPIVHVMGYFVAVLRQRISNFESRSKEAPPTDEKVDGYSIGGVSINDLRKNLHEINDHMFTECRSSEARYGISFEASLITSIDPPKDVESALAAINTAHNIVSSDISLAQASADQKIVQSKRAVEIETLKAQAEVEPLNQLAAQLRELKKSGTEVLNAYVRNIRKSLFSKASRTYLETK